jgi:hypothetical protein
VLINHQSEKYAKKSRVLDEIGQSRCGFGRLEKFGLCRSLDPSVQEVPLPHRQYNMKQPRRRCLEPVTTGGKEYQGLKVLAC